ncbi:hypothetical protein OE647_04610 [Defluviimonas sp. WL0075]|uniref:Uncharacterized protein n=1 Tax=Albidovulum sediminicola TaxID=2984331 RepID=A0ABT2YYU9_9RHOB|nr:hypothetical protein [Defluviimonas sp. WL0075]
MKSAVAFFLRFARKNSEQTDAFGARLMTMSKPRTPRPTRAAAPSLFKRGARAA